MSVTAGPEPLVNPRAAFYKRLPVISHFNKSVGLQRGMLVAGLVLTSLFLLTALFAPLMALATEQEPGRRGQALALWTLAFALATVAFPHVLEARPESLLPTAGAAGLVGILACIRALAGPRLSFGR